MVKLVCLLACAASLAAGADLREIVRRAVDLDGHNSQVASDYTFLQRQEVRELDGSGHVKGRKTETFDITMLEGSSYRRLVARNDQPLSADEQQHEEAKLQASIQERQHETSQERERRVAEWRKKQDRQHEPVKEVPDAFDFTLTQEAVLGGRPVWVIDAAPKPGYKPKSASAAAFLPKVKLRLWIDQQDYQAARTEVEVVDTVTFGGVLVRLSKGSRLVIEQTRVNDEVWLPHRFSLAASARVLLVKGFNRELDYTFSDYKKFRVESRVVSTGTAQERGPL